VLGEEIFQLRSQRLQKAIELAVGVGILAGHGKIAGVVDGGVRPCVAKSPAGWWCSE
jgi:hypothetical protein